MSTLGYPPQGPGGNGMQQTPAGEQKASQACLSCRKQKRKCTKDLPACELCARMQRPCDYSNPPNEMGPEDIRNVMARLAHLEQFHSITNQNSPNRSGMAQSPMNHPSAYQTPSSINMSITDNNGASGSQDHPWPGILNKFPKPAFLDRDVFKSGGIKVPKPNFEIPSDVLEVVGEAHAVRAIVREFFETIHTWLPILSKKQWELHLTNQQEWQAGPEVALLFFCMKLLISRPQDNYECSQFPVYLSAKRFLTTMEAAGMIHINVLQAGLLLAWYEYGQAIYPAAWMTSGWCVRYATLLGIDKEDEAASLLEKLQTWSEQEERRRTWWGVLVLDNVISVGNSGGLMSPPEISAEFFLPDNDSAWDNGDIASATQVTIDSSIDEPVSPFARLCQATFLTSQIYAHRRQTKFDFDADRDASVTQLSQTLNALIVKITSESSGQDFLGLTAGYALACSALFVHLDPYSCPSRQQLEIKTKEATEMKNLAVDSMLRISRELVIFTDSITKVVEFTRNIEKVSPIIMEAVYSASCYFAWMVKETGDEELQVASERLKAFLRLMGSRWRNAAEYVRILEAVELTGVLA